MKSIFARVSFVLLGLIAYCNAQVKDNKTEVYEATPPPGFEGLTCWQGTRDSTDKNNQPDNWEYCTDDESACLTKVEISGEDYRVYKQCMQKKACQNLRHSHFQQCYSNLAQENNARVCFFCCYTDTCNTDQDIKIPGMPDFKIIP